jgi:hypothetical protein
MRDAAWRAVSALWLALFAWTVAVAVAGRVDPRPLGLPVLARTPWPTAVVGATVLAVALALRRRGIAGDLDAIGAVVSRRAPALALALIISLSSGLVAVRFGTFAAGGSDSYCYVEQAERWAAGTMLAPLEPGFRADWPEAALSLTPTGFVPSRRVEGAIAPICPAGLSLLMAVPRIAGAPPSSVFYVVPALAALGVWAAFLIGRRLAGGSAGLASALLTATGPIFLYQSVQPMSDVPATAFWLLALALIGRRGGTGFVGAGVCAGLAILMRPNLAPLAGLPVCVAAVRLGEESGLPRERLRRATLIAAGLVPGVLGVALVQHVVYGSALSSGYGSLDVLFRLAHVGPNLRRYPGWLIETQTPLVLLGLVSPLVSWRLAPSRLAYALLLLFFALGAFAAYLPYVPFDQWWFLRLWLPGIPPLIALTVAVVAWVGEKPPTPLPLARAAVFVAGGLALTALVAWQLDVARDRAVFDLQRMERKFIATGDYVRQSLPANAVVLTIWQSGAVRYYGERTAVLWDAIAPADLDRVLASLESQGRDPFVVLEDWERERFTSRFRGASAIAELDWPPRVRIGQVVTVWSTRDRERFVRGESVSSERVWLP